MNSRSDRPSDLTGFDLEKEKASNREIRRDPSAANLDIRSHGEARVK